VNAAGDALVYAGFLGGSDFDVGTGIAVDSAGNAYVTGYTSSTAASFPDTPGALDQSDNAGGNDAFVAKVAAFTPAPPPLPSDPLAQLATAIKKASPPLSATLAADLLGRIHTIEKELKQGKTGEACAELGKLANRIQKALTTKPPGLTSAQAHDFLKLVSAAKKTIGC
jgi:Beta-propeller repeat